MKQPAKQSEETRVVGLASENKLPEAFKARTDEDAGTVELRKPNHRGVDIAIASYQAAANLLGTFAQDGEPSLDPGATITIVDNFTNKSTTITASTFVDAAAVFHAFVVRKGRYKPQTEMPAEDVATPKSERKTSAKPKRAAAPAQQAQVAALPAQVAATKPAEAAPTEAAVAPPAKVGKPASGKGASPSKAAKPAEKQPVKKAAAAPKAKPLKAEPARTETKVPETTSVPASKPATAGGRKGSLAGFPEWARKALKPEYGDATWDFKLLATRVSLDKENGKKVLGPDDGKAEHHGFGYEVLIHGKHAAWVVAEAQDAFHLTGVDGYETTRHRNIDPAVYIRIRRVIYPLLGHAEPEGL
jgi:hypothetical protein